MASTGFSFLALTVCVAPNSLAHCSFRSSTSTAMIVLRAGELGAGDRGVARRRRSRTPRRSRRASRLPVLMAAPMPAMTPQPSSPATSGGASAIDLGALAGGDERLLDERADAERGGELGAVGEGHLLRRVVGGEAVPGASAAAGPALAADRAPVQDDVVAGCDVGDAVTDGSRRHRPPRGPSRNGKSSLMPPSR